MIPVGVALAGAMKNVIAIAAGCAVGLGLGDNAKAAILTRGLSEIARFSSVLGRKVIRFSVLLALVIWR